MGKRYYIPRFIGEDAYTASQISEVLNEHNAERIRTKKWVGVNTFALANDDDSAEAFKRFIELSNALKSIHTNCVAMSYSSGEKFDKVFGTVEGQE